MQKSKDIKQHRYGYGARPMISATSQILECACGNRYIKTRARQNACLKCFLR